MCKHPFYAHRVETATCLTATAFAVDDKPLGGGGGAQKNHVLEETRHHLEQRTMMPPDAACASMLPWITS